MSQIPGIIGFGALALLALYFAKKTNYFAFSENNEKSAAQVRWYHVAVVFAIYFVAVTIVVQLIAQFIRYFSSSSPPISGPTWINFLTSFLILGSILFYALTVPKEITRKIWRRDSQNSLLDGLLFAFFSFIIAFPLVIFLNEAFDFVLSTFFGVKELPDQLAVRFLKMTFEYPSYFFLSVVTIVILAPVLEETLFRGFLQSFLRRHLGPKAAIFVTSLCFSFFHYSPEQGLSNLSIIASLFALALFLGFTYEKQGSLLSSIFLHASFNAVSVLNLYFLGGFSFNI